MLRNTQTSPSSRSNRHSTPAGQGSRAAALASAKGKLIIVMLRDKSGKKFTVTGTYNGTAIIERRGKQQVAYPLSTHELVEFE